MATLPSLEAGGSRQLLAEWADNPANLILFTGRAPVSLADHRGVLVATSRVHQLSQLQTSFPCALCITQENQLPNVCQINMDALAEWHTGRSPAAQYALRTGIHSAPAAVQASAPAR